MSFIRTVTLAVTTIALIAVCACAPPAAVSPVTTISAVPSVQKSAPFGAVTASFRAGAYSDALTKVQAMENRPDLSPADRAYLDKQAAICRAKLSPSAAAQMVSSSPATAGTLATPAATASDCGPRALLFVCRESHVPATLAVLTAVAGTKPAIGTSMAGLSDAAKGVGFAPIGVQVDADALKQIHPPALAWVGGDRCIAVTRVRNDTATVYDPATEKSSDIAETDLLKASGGALLLLPRKNTPDRGKGTP